VRLSLLFLFIIAGCAGNIGGSDADEETPVVDEPAGRQASNGPPTTQCRNPKTWYKVLADIDSDGYFAVDIDVTHVACEAPTGYSDKVDCNDNERLVFLTRPLYDDKDDDKIGAGKLKPTCVKTLDELPPLHSLTNTDCDDTSSKYYKLTSSDTLFRDEDGDGVGANSRCVGDAHKTSSSNNDCNDLQPQVISEETFFVDNDKDHVGTNVAQMACPHTPGVPPPGFSKFSSDCDDNNIHVYKLADAFLDQDGDGWGRDSHCVGDTSPLSTNNWDCKDDEPELKWLRWDLYVDEDRDRDGAGPVQTVCTKNGEVPLGYSDNNRDCAPTEGSVSPSQSGWFDKVSPLGSFDYNCNGVDDPKYREMASSCLYTFFCRLPVDGWYLNAPRCGQTGDWGVGCDEVSPGVCRIRLERRTQVCR